MRKVGSTTDTADANGEYTNGNVANGIPPTIINAEMMNTFQRELVNVVEGAGLELDPDDDSQVLKAIGGGRLLNIVTFTKSGTYTPTKGTKKIKVTITGGGASGGKSAGSSTY
ncbi:phage tail protein, partial [Escherichia coli]